MKTNLFVTEDLQHKSRKELIRMTGVASMKTAVAKNMIAPDKKTNSIARDIA